jgi:DNA-binding transcriptional regulator GbsR (MarR family)
MNCFHWDVLTERVIENWLGVFRIGACCFAWNFLLSKSIDLLCSSLRFYPLLKPAFVELLAHPMALSMHKEINYDMSLTVFTIISVTVVVGEDAAGKVELGECEWEMIQQWVILADSLGIPRSYAQIYGLCFVSQKPVSAQDCVDRLKISRSSAGQGLRLLREIGAIRSCMVLGSRVETFKIEPDLGRFIRSLLSVKVAPAFDGFFKQLDVLQQASQNSENATFLVGRFKKLQRWRNKLAQAHQWLTN